MERGKGWITEQSNIGNLTGIKTDLLHAEQTLQRLRGREQCGREEDGVEGARVRFACSLCRVAFHSLHASLASRRASSYPNHPMGWVLPSGPSLGSSCGGRRDALCGACPLVSRNRRQHRRVGSFGWLRPVASAEKALAGKDAGLGSAATCR